MPVDLFQNSNTPSQPNDLFAQNGIAVQNQPSLTNSQKFSNAITQTDPFNNIGTGVLTALKNLGQNLPNVTNMYKPGQSPIDQMDPYKIMGTSPGQNWYSPTTIEQGIGQYLPYAAAGTETAIGKGLSMVPKVGDYLENSPVVNWAAKQLGSGAVFGGTQSPGHPLAGALTGAIGQLSGSTIGHGIGLGFNTDSSLSGIKDYLLNYLNKATKSSNALSPAETAENIGLNYTTNQGQQMPVDIGTAANNPLLQKIYSSSGYVPFTGTRNAMNQVAIQQGTKGIENADKNLQDAMSDYADKRQAYESQQQGLQVQSQQGKELSVNLQDQLSSLTKDYNNHQQAINAVPDYINSLPASVSDRTKVTSSLKDDVKGLYDDNKQTAKSMYEPINSSDIQLDKLDPDYSYPNYGSAVNDMLAQKENLKNLFGTDSDLGSRVLSEVQKGENFLQNGDTYASKLQDVVARGQNLGKLEAAARGQGSFNEARILGNLRTGLMTDVHNLLDSSGNGDVSDALKNANDYYKTNVVPFWQTPQIRKSVLNSNYIPQTDSLAKELYNPNNHGILFDLSPDTQNTALYQLVTQGKGTSSGLTTQTAKDFANRYQSLPVDTKVAVQAHNPQADMLLQNLSAGLDRYQQLGKMKDDLTGQIDKNQTQVQRFDDKSDRLKEPSTSGIESAQQQLVNAKNKKYGSNLQPSTGTEALANMLMSFGKNIAGKSSFALGAALRGVPQALRSPDLINAYTQGTQLPIKNQSLQEALTNQLLKSYTTTQATNIGNQ